MISILTIYSWDLFFYYDLFMFILNFSILSERNKTGESYNIILVNVIV